jgi:starch phosphorylase
MDELRRDILRNLFFVQGRFRAVATRNDWYLAVAHTVRDRLLARWLESAESYLERESRTVCYLSAEFLLGPQLGNNLLNIGIEPAMREAVRSLGLELDELLDQEEEPGLGNGGLGRLAACYLDSLATLQIPSIGYGIRYEFGIFDQAIRDGWQMEVTDKWLRLGNPWEIARPEIVCDVGFGGRTETWRDGEGRHRVRWIPDRLARGVAHDIAVLGYRVANANMLRLWSAEAVESFDFQAFNVGDYLGAIQQKLDSENLTKVLYPNDSSMQGKVLRLEQQYFFVCCSLQDMIRIYRQRPLAIGELADKYAVQLNDTHPSIAIAELMRLLVDEHLMPWASAWELTRRTFSYTNHTLLPEALERWPVELFRSLLPRHLEIIYEINRRFLDRVREIFPGDEERVARMSLIDESAPRSVRMAHLACAGSHTVNGVSALHTALLGREVLRDFSELAPDRLKNVTNGVSPRRFLLLANPRLCELVREHIGDDFGRRLDDLRRLEPRADDPSFAAAWRQVKLDNKRALVTWLGERTGVVIDPQALLSVQVKRFHEYKRQHLNALQLVARYRRILRDPGADVVPRTVLFGGKAAPGYQLAKLIIRLINGIAEVVNQDPVVAGRLRVVFLPDYNVQNAVRIIPAADLSEQISTAGMEASGTGNMKLALNGALTIGTLDGANVEIREEVGAENFFLFGLRADEVLQLRSGGYEPRRIYLEQGELREAIDLIAAGAFSRGDRDLFRPLIDQLLERDRFFVLADFAAYMAAEDEVDRCWRDHEGWTRMSIRNVARMGKFSSDRAVSEYAREIWRVEPAPVVLDSRL